MAFSVLSKPGTKFGPCKKACKHADCAATRKIAESLCPFCGDPIGYNTPFADYSDALTVEQSQSTHWHNDCLETWAEQEHERAEGR